MAWCSSKLDASLLHSDSSSLSLSFQSRNGNLKFNITNVYAPFEDQARQPFFSSLTNLRLNVTGPWMVLGDFNIYRFAHEKNTGQLNQNGMDIFNNWIRDQGLIDI